MAAAPAKEILPRISQLPRISHLGNFFTRRHRPISLSEIAVTTVERVNLLEEIYYPAVAPAESVDDDDLTIERN